MLTLTEKYKRDCMHYFVKDDSEEWHELSARHNELGTIDIANDLIRFSIHFERKSFINVDFSYHTKEFKGFKWLPSAKTVKTERVHSMVNAYTNFLTDMIEHGFLEGGF